MNIYEVLFIIASDLDDAKKAEVVSLVKEIISNGGEVVGEDIIGTKKLAYPILKKAEGYYVLLNFKAPADLPKELARRLRILDSVVRFIIINKDEDKEV
jgi:small subunit ribosomal protein S6